MKPLSLFAIGLVSLFLTAPDPVGTIIERMRNRDLLSAEEAAASVGQLTAADCERLSGAMRQLSPQGDWIPLLKVLADKSGENAEFLFFVSQASWRAGDVGSAMEISGKAIEADPGNADLVYRCAAIARTSGRLEEAKRRIELVFEADPGNADARFLLGSILSESGDEEGARTQLLEVLKNQPDHFRSHYELGKLETRTGNDERALAHLNAAVNVYPFFREAYSAMRVPLARLKKQDDIQKVQAILDHTRQWDPNKYARLRYSFQNAYRIPPEGAMELASELAAVFRNDLAKTYLENLHSQNKTTPQLRLMLAQLRFNEGEFQPSLNLLDSILQEEIRKTDTYWGLKGWALLKNGEAAKSREVYETHKESFPDSPHFAALGGALDEYEANRSMTGDQVDEEEPGPPIRFIEKTEEAGLSGFRHALGSAEKLWIVDAMGSGLAAGDYDGDGDDDLYLVNGRPDIETPDPKWRNALFRNEGGRFVDVTETAGVGDTGVGMCAVFGDVDGDGHLDLFVGNYGPNVFYRNNGDGTFSDQTAETGLAHGGYAAAAAFGDVDNDGDLDLFVGNYVEFDPAQHGDMRENYHGQFVMMGPKGFKHQDDLLYINDGSGRFTDNAAAAGINVSEGRAMGAVFFDLENDGDLDLYVANDSTHNHVLRNNGLGVFEDVSFISGGAVGESGRDGASMGAAAGDMNNDGSMDIYVTSYEQESDVLFENSGGGMFMDMTGPRGLIGPTRWLVTWGTGFCDFDSDGLLDLYTVNGHIYPQVENLDTGRTYNQGISIYRNTGERFEDISQSALPPRIAETAGRGSALLDYDGDGDMDLAVNCIDAGPVLLENVSERGSWLQVELKGPSAWTRGTRITARAGESLWTREVDGGSGYLSQNSAVVHFGFGDLDKIDGLTVHWRHRGTQFLESPEINRRIAIDAEAASLDDPNGE